MIIDLETIGYFLFMEEQEQLARSRSIIEEEDEDQKEDNSKGFNAASI